MAEALLTDVPQEEVVALFGSRDENLRILRDAVGVQVTARNGTVTFRGTDEQVEAGLRIFNQMRVEFKAKRSVTPEDVRAMTFVTGVGAGVEPGPAQALEIAGSVKRLRSRTEGQTKYIAAIRTNDLVFAIGPAGTGKTYLAVALAVEALRARQVKRLVLVRPAVEAGEKLGFLPGDPQAKVHPFLAPLLDALRDMLDFHQVRTYMENDVVEIAPLAYMRGRTLNESFIILDEGQNTTIPQMKMFLTRMGMGSKIVVTGDLTQADLPLGMTNGLEDAVARLENIPGVGLVRLTHADIVRHSLVQRIVNAYDDKPTNVDQNR